jgi:hypothetical protein
MTPGERGPAVALAAVVAGFVALALAVAVLTPPWEANDEPDHVRNVQSLVEGRMYQIGDGFESHQAPLYYVALAGWQLALGIEPRVPSLVSRESSALGRFRHDTSNDGADQRLVTSLRLPGIGFGVLTLLLTAATARLVSRDPWTPVVAAAVVAGVPKFVFLSGVVNNDNLATLAGALTTFAALHLLLRPPASDRERLIACGVVGICVGATLLSKATAGTIVLPALVAVVAIARRAGRMAAHVAALAVGALLVAGQWLVYNVLTYGDPLGLGAQTAYLRSVIPALFVEGGHLDRMLVAVPRGAWKSFWYVSGWNQFSWPEWAYFPFWGGIAVALVRWLQPGDTATRVPRRALVLLGAAALAGISTVLIVGAFTTQEQARIGFIGLSAIAVLVALGLERWRAPLVLRFALPALGLIGTVIAIRQDIVGIYL